MSLEDDLILSAAALIVLTTYLCRAVYPIERLDVRDGAQESDLVIASPWPWATTMAIRSHHRYSITAP